MRSKTVRRLKAFELEQSQSSRKAQIKKEISLKSLAKSLTVWLNFLFENPRSCGCDLSRFIGGDLNGESGTVISANGKRESWPCGGVGIGKAWRSPKRQKDSSWSAVAEVDELAVFTNSKTYLALRCSLQEICSFDDLKQRMGVYLSLGSCKEIFNVMTQVTKNIDEGRIKMKAHCPIVTDVGMKEKATRILMCYNPIWLRMGLYIIFGGDSLLPNGDVNSDQEIGFLRMIVEKQFFSHAGLAKAYAYNKMVDGLYRPGYFEMLGNVILKRFLLLVLILDRAKTQSTLPLKYGIDGIDGGSPLLFSFQSNIKSSRQLIHDFLSSDVMHGEGNLLAHLVIVGYKVSYQQNSLTEYNFRVTDLFDDLQDGVRLCRAIQLLQHDSSILMKLVVPSDTRKKNLANCGIALQYLKQAAVPLYDEDGMMIEVEDVVHGDKELTLSLLWNMFVHLQLPILINNALLFEEISKVRGVDSDYTSRNTSTPLEMLFIWIQAICEKYDFKIDNFASLVDGKAMWCLLDYYFRKELHCCSLKDANESSGKESVVSATDNTNVVHNFILSQKLTTLLGNFPEVLQVSDLLEHNGPCNDRSVVILLVFLSSQLIVKRNTDQLNFHKYLGCSCQGLDRKRMSSEQSFLSSKAALNQDGTDGPNEETLRKFKAIQAWWQEMTERNYTCDTKPVVSTLQCFWNGQDSVQINSADSVSSVVISENAAKVIQSHFRRSIERRRYMKMKNAVSFLQSVIRAWLTARQKTALRKFSSTDIPYERRKQSGRQFQDGLLLNQNIHSPNLVNAVIILQNHIRGWTVRSRDIQRVQGVKALNEGNEFQIRAAVKIQHAWKKFTMNKSVHNQHVAASTIQNHVRSWLLRRRFMNQKQAIIKIQRNYRHFRCLRALQHYIITHQSAIFIQSHVRAWFANKEACRLRHVIVVVQSHCRGWLVRRDFLLQKEAAIKIQSAQRCQKCREEFHCYRNAATEIQRFVRGQSTRSRLLGASCYRSSISNGFVLPLSIDCFPSFELKILLNSVKKVQRWWRGILLLKSTTKTAIIIQSCIRGWIVRQKAIRERQHILVIQSHWKGYLARKESKEQLLDLRLRMQSSAANVDDNMRLINRLLVALSELLNMKSVSGILHTCATLDMATKHSEKCCEKLVAAGAIGTLLKLIRSVSRSIPDQEVLKYALSTLRNLTRYPQLAQVLIDSHGSIETIFFELLRNKEEGYFIASELLKKICSEEKGVNAIRKSPGLLKRLNSLVDDLSSKLTNDKRNARGQVSKENIERRLKEAIELVKLITMG